MTKAIIKAERAPRIRQEIVDRIRPPTPTPQPSWYDMMRALDDLERAGGSGALWPDGCLHAGDTVLDHSGQAYLEGLMRGWVEVGFGRRIILTSLGERAVIKWRWGKLPAPAPEPDEDAGMGMRP